MIVGLVDAAFAMLVALDNGFHHCKRLPCSTRYMKIPVSLILSSWDYIGYSCLWVDMFVERNVKWKSWILFFYYVHAV